MSERQMTIILLVVMGATILLGAVALYYLQFHELATLEEDLARVSAQVDEAQKKKAAIKGLEDKVAKLTTDIEKIRGQIPVFSAKEENDQFMDLVDSLRKKTRVAISSARFSPARTGPGEDLPASIFRARYELKVTGGFYQLLNYLNHLESERRFLVADNIKISAGSVVEGRGTPVRDLQLNLSTFLQRPPPTPAQPVAAKPSDKDKKEEPVSEESRRLSTPIPD